MKDDLKWAKRRQEIWDEMVADLKRRGAWPEGDECGMFVVDLSRRVNERLEAEIAAVEADTEEPTHEEP